MHQRVNIFIEISVWLGSVGKENCALGRVAPLTLLLLVAIVLLLKLSGKSVPVLSCRVSRAVQVLLFDSKS